MSHDGAGKNPVSAGLFLVREQVKKHFQIYWATGIQHMENFNFICGLILLGILLAGNGLHGDEGVVNFEREPAALWNGFMGGREPAMRPSVK